jgi:hypothetical protein
MSIYFFLHNLVTCSQNDGACSFECLCVIDCKELEKIARGLFELLSGYLRSESMVSQKTSRYRASWPKIRPEPPEYEITVLNDTTELSVCDGKLNIVIRLVSRMTCWFMGSNHPTCVGFQHHVLYLFVQGDQKVSVHLIITVQKTCRNILNSFNHLPW